MDEDEGKTWPVASKDSIFPWWFFICKPCVKFYWRPKFSNYLTTWDSNESQSQLVSSQISCSPPLRNAEEISKPGGSGAPRCHRMGGSSGCELRGLSQAMPLWRLQAFLKWPDPFPQPRRCLLPSATPFLVELRPSNSLLLLPGGSFVAIMAGTGGHLCSWALTHLLFNSGTEGTVCLLVTQQGQHALHTQL